VDFFGSGLAGYPRVKLSGDQDPPQLGDHVDIGGAGLGGVPGGPAAAVAGSAGVRTLTTTAWAIAGGVQAIPALAASRSLRN
jgi:hypothetical protein